MNEDMKLAVGILGDVARSARAFERRFGDDVAAALEHCRTALELGLRYEEYRDAVAQSAARSLLSSMPAEPADARLGPHVSRVLGHRDFGLAILLKRGREDAWQVFVERFGTYLKSLFIRSGRTSDEARDLLLDLVRELRGEDGQIGAIADYRGRSDLQNWLFCYIRASFRGGFAARDEGVTGAVTAARTASMPIVDLGAAGVSDDDQELDRQDFGARLRQVFGDQWQALPPRDQKLIEILAAGGSAVGLAASGILAERNRAPDAAQLLARHRQVLEALFDRFFWKLVESFRGELRAPDVEEALHRQVSGELERELMPVLGFELEREA
ncbi:MAG: hypothetical protein H6807_02970 [Planctomycetes bacterium]|nr:hypothetical protein [Planctomycetota bacterium]